MAPVGKRVGAVEEGEGGINGGGRRLDFGDGCMMQCADDALLSCTLETCMVLVTIVTPINSIKKKDKQIHIPETEKKKKQIGTYKIVMGM